jgi:dehydrogenase/reductase SDR family protein 7B
LKPLKDKIVIITGASSGIGKACAIAFAKEGANLTIAARDVVKLEITAKECRSCGVKVIAIQTDVAIEEDCRKLIEAAFQEFGRIDILMNNAGMSMRALFQDANISVLKKLMDVNFWGTVYCTKYALPEILKNKGSIVGVSSIAGYKGLPARTGYSASKFAMNGFLESLRIENMKKGLHVLICAPGFTASNIRNTALTKDGSIQKESPLKENKLMSAEEVAEAIVKAVKNRSNNLILTRTGKLLVFLNKFFPGLVDKLTYSHMAKEANSPLK